MVINNINNNGGTKSGRGGGGGTAYWALSEKVRNTIQSIKEVVKDHSNDEIYAALKESNMDPNETAQKLLNQDPFHEVRRKKDRKKENATEPAAFNLPKPPENYDPKMKVSTQVAPNFRRDYSRSYLPQHAGTARNVLPVTNKEFRIVRDNRIVPNPTRDSESTSQQPPLSSSDGVGSKMTERGSAGSSTGQKLMADHNHSGASKEDAISHSQSLSSSISNGSSRKAVERDRSTVSSSVLHVHGVKSDHSQSQPISLGSNNPSVGLYSSSTDPVHVPSPDSRSSSVVGAIKRDVGVVGGRRQAPEDSPKHSLDRGTSSNLTTGSAYSPGSLHSVSAAKTEQLVQNGSMQSAPSSSSGSRSFLTNQYAGKPNHIGGNLKASQPVKEWKPKSVVKANLTSPGIIGTPPKSISSPLNNSKEVSAETVKLPDRLPELHTHENRNVIIAQHIIIPDAERYQLTFGSFGKGFDSVKSFVHGDAKDDFKGEISASLPESDPTSSDDGDSGGKQADVIEDQARNSSLESPTSSASSESPLPDKKAAVPQNLDMGLIGLVRDGGRSYSPSESQQLQREPPEMPNFLGYEAQAGYDMAYFRTSMDEPVQMQGPPSQEALTSHMANSLPATTISLGGQAAQAQALAQMYPPVHVSHFANMMPYRQFISPVYMSPMAVPGYSGNPAYPHPSSGNSYMLMPGGASHINSGALKYGMQQFKPVQGSSPTGFGNFANHFSYSVNSAGGVGNAAGIDDPSRVKYKDSNLYIPNPQAEASEIWIQTPRDVPGMQSAQYYNLPGQAPPHAAYMPHAGHGSFNSGAPQSSHMQFPSPYHPSPQAPPSAIPNAHHLNPSLAGNLGVGVAAAAPVAQVGAYQQLGHLNWTSNF
ncbi:hypothetical protein MLD38_029486 [Melastoma candidum]|uniref:Uncharacterized protein n=1 Tax=Melastoma candidum TaxID=119954 RepID=A0ACB9N3W6_9MYRT|nr:hypothetical protein MLD38_029486 [Melastoma candidum]